jgi:hypothetical protein
MMPTRLRSFVWPGVIAISGLLISHPSGAATGDTPAAAPHEASIPFAAESGVRTWRADGSQGLWVQAHSGAWFYGKFAFPCNGLQFREALGFKFSPGGALDRWSEVHTHEAGRCVFRSFDTSTGPPVKPKKAPQQKADAS